MQFFFHFLYCHKIHFIKFKKYNLKSFGVLAPPGASNSSNYKTVVGARVQGGKVRWRPCACKAANTML
jgi:hypothetical protein